MDFLETFSPTANAASIRLIVALACKFDWELLHLDIEQAFVQSELDHEVFMKLPQGCGSMSGKIVRLNKSLYGLRQASRTFNKRLVVDLKRIGFEQCLSDPCVLRFMMGDEVLGMVVIHVDDILFGGLKRIGEFVVQALVLSRRRTWEKSFSFWVAHFGATVRLARLRFLRRVTFGVYLRDSKFVAPARSPLPLPTITGP